MNAGVNLANVDLEADGEVGGLMNVNDVDDETKVKTASSRFC